MQTIRLFASIYSIRAQKPFTPLFLVPITSSNRLPSKIRFNLEKQSHSACILVQKGLRNLNETVLLQVNNEEVPISIQLIGHYKSVNRKQNQDCPDFSRSNKKYRPNPKKRKSKLSTTASNIILIDKQNLVTNESTIDKPTNLILLIDASTSMNDEVKKELLRVALLELTATFKPTDQLTVMSYSSDANVLLPQQKAVSANQLDSILQHLEVGGFTNGSLGILEAYKMADSIYDIHANNEIILATDGAFNTNETNDIIEDIIDTYASTDIKLSILGIRNQSWAADDMKKLTEAGNGKYIHVNSLQNAKKSLKKR